jgi:Ser/Thr protein kinase RdoA (MazF antagonist)
MSIVVDHKGPSTSTSTYHRLAMRRLADDPVQAQDLEVCAMSLIRAVAKLHQAGSLHCNLKPWNVVWDVATQNASLVDIGHAQMEAGAKV